MEIAAMLHSTNVQQQQAALQQIMCIEPSEVISMFAQSGDVMLLTVIDYRAISCYAAASLFQIEHRKAQQLAAYFSALSDANFYSCIALMHYAQSERIRANFLIELVLLQSDFQQQAYFLAMRQKFQDFRLYLSLLEAVCGNCKLDCQHFSSVINYQFMELCVKEENAQLASQVLMQLFYKFEYKTAYSCEGALLTNALQYLLAAGVANEWIIATVARLFLLGCNKRLQFYHVFIPFLRYSLQCLQYFNHYNCLYLVPALIKLYENRQIQQIRNIFLQIEGNITQFESQDNLKQIIDIMLKNMQVELPVVSDYSANIDQMTTQLVYCMLKYIDKRGLANLLQIANYVRGSYPALAPHEEQLYFKYNTYDPLFWLDWFGSLKSNVTSLFSKIAVLYPSLCLKIGKEVLFQSWSELSVAAPVQMITQKHDIFMTFDIAVFFVDTTICSILRLLLNENDYPKQTMLNLNDYVENVDLLLVDQFSQPAILYRTVYAACEIPKYISKLTNLQQSQQNLFCKYERFLSRVLKSVIYKLCMHANFRMQNEEQAAQQQLFYSLSQDTLAFRRMVVTKLCSSMQSPILNRLLVDRDEQSEESLPTFAFHQQMIDCVNYYMKNGLLTESENIKLTLVKLAILVNVSALEKTFNVYSQSNILNELMNYILASVQQYFCYPAIQGAAHDTQAFIYYFNVQGDNFYTISSESISVKRKLLFKLEEALSTLPVIRQIAGTKDLVSLLDSLTCVITSLLQVALRAAARLKFLSQSFVFNNSYLKVNLMAEYVQQYLQIDTDSVQSLSSETGYALEWLENCVQLSVQTLVYCGQAAALSQAVQGVGDLNLPFSLVKIMFDKMQRFSFCELDQHSFYLVYYVAQAYITYFYYPQAFLQKLNSHSPHYDMFSKFVESLPYNARQVDSEQILNKTAYIAKEQIETAMQQIIQASAKSYIELVSKLFFDFSSKQQLFQPQSSDVAFLMMCCFVESKPGRILSLLEQLHFACDAQCLLPALLLLCAVDNGVASQVVQIIARNPQSFRNLCDFIPVSVPEGQSQKETKRKLQIALQAARFVD